MRIAHIINPVKVPPGSDLCVAQPLTFESIRLAKSLAEKSLDVSLYSAQYPEDADFVPSDFEKTPDLDRSVLDLFHFKVKRKLPILSDILDRLFTAADADYFIYSNVDIPVTPHFYLAVKRIIETGYDAFVINRRTISKKSTSVADLPLMLAEIGQGHKGYDCFVFRKDAYPHFYLADVCTGMPWIGRVLLWNLVLCSTQFMEFKDFHLTFHLGNDRVWDDDQYADYANFNKEQAHKILAHFESRKGAVQRLDNLGYLRNLNTPVSASTKGSGQSAALARYRFLFIAGLHRSGTSIIANCLKQHPQVSGFVDTGVPQDEGQFLQSIYPPAKAYGGPGVFGFHKEMHVTESSGLVSENSRRRLFREWSRYWDMSKPVLLEKSPPNLLKTRFLQSLFPNSYFVIVTRHPIPTSYATQKWSKTPIFSLLRHWIQCHKIFAEDRPLLKNCLVIKYEDFVVSPQEKLEAIFNFAHLPLFSISLPVKTDINQFYFQKWKAERATLSPREKLKSLFQLLLMNRQVKPFGYSLFCDTSN